VRNKDAVSNTRAFSLEMKTLAYVRNIGIDECSHL